MLRTFVSATAWPALLSVAIATTALGFHLGAPVAAFNGTYIGLVLATLALERAMPHERDWSRPDGQVRADLAHTIFSGGVIQTCVVFSGAIGLSGLIARVGHSSIGVWPHHWPLAAQVALGLCVSEFAAYWAHRLAHEWEPLWYFHAIHHSVEKLWCVNSGRFHFVDAMKSVGPGFTLMLMVGASPEVMAWLSALTGYIGMLTHCNVDMRFGPLSYVFNTPELHRWHHSRDLREGNKNYGENIAIWDLAFGTYFKAPRRPPADIGIADPMPPRFTQQLAWPFRKLARPRAAAPEPFPSNATEAVELG